MLTAQFRLRDLVNFCLDLLPTDIDEYDFACKLPPLANNHHCVIPTQGTPYKSAKYKKANTRKITPQSKLSVLGDITAESWQTVLDAVGVDNKIDCLHQTVEDIQNKHCPLVCHKVRSDRPSWMRGTIPKTIRNCAYKRGGKSWKFLQCIIQQRIRSNKRTSVREILNSDLNTREWWQTLKRLMGQAHWSNNEPTHAIDGKRMSSIDFAEELNNHYVCRQ